MKRATLLLLFVGLAVATAGGAFGQNAPQIPLEGFFTEEDLEVARLRALETPPPGSDWEGDRRPDETIAPSTPGFRLNDDNDTAHYARGTTLVLHIFVSHTGGTYTGTEMASAAAAAQTAKDWYRNTAPYGANIHFDHDGTNGYYYLTASLPYLIPHDGFTYGMMNEILTSWGYSDADGDGAIVDDFTASMQNWAGGWDNVISTWEPRQTGRSWAGAGLAYCFLYFGAPAGVYAHEWGHVYGACDEYVEEGHCGGGIDCNVCRNYYLLDLTENGNCALPACPLNIPCVMKYNTWNLCDYTHEVWGWDDSDGNGILDTAKRKIAGETYVMIYEVPGRTAMFWNGVDGGFVLSQRWTSWAAAGLRGPANADYDLTLYGDNNHNYLYAGSALGTGSVDFVVGDYNHATVGNEHLAVTHYSGSWDNYELFWDSGDDLLFADGIERSEYWHPLEVVRAWDLPLFAGERVSFQVTPNSANLDLGMALFRSNGTPYWSGRSGAQWEVDSYGIGGIEYITWTVPADDVYGFVLFSKVESGGDYTLQIGGIPYTLAEESPVTTGGDLQLYNYDPNAGYWSLTACRPAGDTDVRLALFDDANYQTPLEDASDAGVGGMELLAVDYNHAPVNRDHLRMVRTWGGGTHTIEWEHDPEIISAPVGGWWISGYLGKVWDAGLLAGQSYFLRQYHAPGSVMDTGVYLFASTDGDSYKSRSDAAAGSDAHAAGEGGEWFSYTPPQNDWYGVYFTVPNDGADSYSIWLGPQVSPAEGYTAALAEPVVFGEAEVWSPYWTVFAARAQGGGPASIWLYGDDAYSSSGFLADDQSGQSVVYIVGDFNHSPYATYYPRYLHEGGGAMSFQWESGPETVTFTPGQTNSYNWTWPTGNIAAMWDVHVDGSVAGGRDVRFLVSDLSGTNDFSLACFASNGAAYFGTFLNALGQADATGIGGTEEITVHLDREDWYGLLLTSKSPAGGGSYLLQVIDPAGASSVQTQDAGVFSLRARTGNPFDSSIGIEFGLPDPGQARVSVYDIQGREVRRLHDVFTPGGTRTVTWDGSDSKGNQAATGVYFVRLNAGGRESTIRIVRDR